MVIGKDGMPRDLVLSESSDPTFGTACLAAASKWRFKPALVKGKPVSTQVSLPFVRDAE
jgi:outer membrane biosynthesis protein TonB